MQDFISLVTLTRPTARPSTDRSQYRRGAEVGLAPYTRGKVCASNNCIPNDVSCDFCNSIGSTRNLVDGKQSGPKSLDLPLPRADTGSDRCWGEQ